MTDKYLAGKVAWVTGGASGMGRATALALARAGANVAVGSLVASQRKRREIDPILTTLRRCRAELAPEALGAGAAQDRNLESSLLHPVIPSSKSKSDEHARTTRALAALTAARRPD